MAFQSLDDLLAPDEAAAAERNRLYWLEQAAILATPEGRAAAEARSIAYEAEYAAREAPAPLSVFVSECRVAYEAEYAAREARIAAAESSEPAADDEETCDGCGFPCDECDCDD